MAKRKRQQSKGLDPKQFPACLTCQQRHIKCQNTIDGSNFPCRQCIIYGTADTCADHLTHASWQTGKSGATNHTNARRRAEARLANGGARRQKKLAKRAANKRGDGGSDESEDESSDDEEYHQSLPAPNVPIAAPLGRPLRSTRRSASYRDEYESEEDDAEADDEEEVVSDEVDGEIIVVASKKSGGPEEVAAEHETRPGGSDAEKVAHQEKDPQNSESDDITPMQHALDNAPAPAGARLVLGVMEERLAADGQASMVGLQRLLNKTLGRPAGAGAPF